ncbi:MAG: hypothetical protein VX833_03260 [Actinomycetota bacterium]|nr:hypothetical protein [Actinomycetota bacterium]
MNPQWALLLGGALVVVMAPVATSCGTDEDVSVPTSTTVMVHGHPDSMGSMDEMTHEHGSHEHGDLIDLSDLAEPPTVSLTATADGIGGAMLEFAVTGLELVSVDPLADHRPGQGHLHVVVDGSESVMTAETRYHVSGLANGHHTVTVILSANDHRNYGINRNAIGASTTVMVTGGEDRQAPDGSFSVEISGGTVVGGIPRLEASMGDLILITVTSDIRDEVHLHVYDLTVVVGPGEPAVFNIEATIPGIFEAELHDAGFRVFELEVS